MTPKYIEDALANDAKNKTGFFREADSFVDKLEFCLYDHLIDQNQFSLHAFGPPKDGAYVAGVIDHIKKELEEIEKEPTDLEEWIDVVILATDGAWRAGYSPDQIIEAWKAKLEKNKNRKWPDWRTAEPGKAIEHIREEETNS